LAPLAGGTERNAFGAAAHGEDAFGDGVGAGVGQGEAGAEKGGCEGFAGEDVGEQALDIEDSGRMAEEVCERANGGGRIRGDEVEADSDNRHGRRAWK